MIAPSWSAPAAEHLLGPAEVLLLHGVVTAEERATLSAWAAEQSLRGALLQNPRHPLVRSTVFMRADGSPTLGSGTGPQVSARAGRSTPVWAPTQDGTGGLPPAFWRVRDRVVDRLGPAAEAEDPYKGSFLSWVLPGGRVHCHRDEFVVIDEVPCDVVRCNVVISAPRGGGVPRIAGVKLPVDEGNAWAFYATRHLHETDVVQEGGAPRGTLSFGFLVPPAAQTRRGFVADDEAHLSVASVDGHDTCIGDVRAAGPHRVRSLLTGLDPRLVAVLAPGSGQLRTVSELASAIDRAPIEVLWLLETLQSVGLVRSVSSQRLHGSVVHLNSSVRGGRHE